MSNDDNRICMLPLSMQIVITAMFSRKALGLVAAKESGPIDFKDLDLEGCQKLISDTLALLAEIKPEDVNGKEAEAIEFNVGKRAAKANAYECT